MNAQFRNRPWGSGWKGRICWSGAFFVSLSCMAGDPVPPPKLPTGTFSASSAAEAASLVGRMKEGQDIVLRGTAASVGDDRALRSLQGGAYRATGSILTGAEGLARVGAEFQRGGTEAAVLEAGQFSSETLVREGGANLVRTICGPAAVPCELNWRAANVVGGAIRTATVKGISVGDHLTDAYVDVFDYVRHGFMSPVDYGAKNYHRRNTFERLDSENVISAQQRATAHGVRGPADGRASNDQGFLAAYTGLMLGAAIAGSRGGRPARESTHTRPEEIDWTPSSSFSGGRSEFEDEPYHCPSRFVCR